MSNVQMSKKVLKRVLKKCIKNLDTISSDADILALIIQFKTKEDKYEADFHINDANVSGDEHE